MSNLRHRLPQLSLAHGFLAVSTCILLGLLVAGCGSSASASKATTGKLAAATASPTCPPVVPTKAVSGAVRAVSSGSFTLATTTGATATVHLTSSTHFTRQVTATTADLVVGQAVDVSTDTSGVTALRVVVTGTASSASGSGTRGFGGFTGTPRTGTPFARGNAGCFRNSTATSVGSGSFSGIRGTLTTVTTTQLVLSDTKGNSYTIAITPSTVIISLSSATASDLSVGDSVIAVGTTSSTGITARTVMIDLPTTSNS